MFNKRVSEPAAHAGAARRSAPTGFSVLGADVVVTGNLQATADLHVEGRIDGDVDCGNLVIGPDATVKGQVRGESARLAGTIEGSVSIRQLTVEASARITGDVEYEAISIENGARIDGHLRHSTRTNPAAKPVKLVEGPVAAA